MIEFGVGIPQVVDPDPTELGGLDEFLSGVEELEYHSAWVMDHPLRGAPTFEPLTLLTHAAARTRTIKLGAGVLLMPLRIPVELAMTLSTLDQLSRGRLIAGVGLGEDRSYYSAFGIDPKSAVRRFVEGIELLKLLWTEDVVHFDGDFWRVDGLSLTPKPFQRPRPPVWIGARKSAALERAAKLSDGWLGAGNSTVAEFREQVGLLREYLRQAGKNPSEFHVGKRVYLAVTDEPGLALRRLRNWFGRFYGDPSRADRVALVGSPQQCIEGLTEMADAGATLLILNPVFDELHQLRVLRELLPGP